jgi:uncharacterized protein
MRKLLILLFALVSAGIQAQENNSILWEISGNGLSQPSYLFGTLHMIPKKDYFFTPEMEKAFKSCNRLVIEADMFSLSLSEQVNLAKQAILPNGKTLKNYMDSVGYVQFKQFLHDSLGIKESKIDNKYARIKPFFLTALLLKEYAGKTKTYEQELHKTAKKQKMELIGLETIEFQMSLAEQMPIGEQLDGLTDLREFRDYYHLVGLYKQQNLNGLYAVSVGSFNTEKEMQFIEILINQRNIDWIKKIQKLASEKPCFIAVGAMHLPGEKGVIELLKKEGYTLKPVF